MHGRDCSAPGVTDIVDSSLDKVHVLGVLGVAHLRDRPLPSYDERVLSGPNLQALRDKSHSSTAVLFKYLAFFAGPTLDYRLASRPRCYVVPSDEDDAAQGGYALQADVVLAPPSRMVREGDLLLRSPRQRAGHDLHLPPVRPASTR